MCISWKMARSLHGCEVGDVKSEDAGVGTHKGAIAKDRLEAIKTIDQFGRTLAFSCFIVLVVSSLFVLTLVWSVCPEAVGMMPVVKPY